MSEKSNGVVPPKWLEARKPIWIRKCRIVKFDKDLGHYELIYACGYSIVVRLTDISPVMEKHQLWAKSTNAKIIELVNDAEQDWNNFNRICGSSDAEHGVLVPIENSEKGVASTGGSDSDAIDGRILISETTNSSESLKGKEVAVEGNSIGDPHVSAVSINRGSKKASGAAVKKKKFRSHVGFGNKLNIETIVGVSHVERGIVSAANVMTGEAVVITSANFAARSDNVSRAPSNCGSTSSNGLQSARVVASVNVEDVEKSSTVNVVQSVDFSVDTFPLHPNKDGTSCWINTGMQVMC